MIKALETKETYVDAEYRTVHYVCTSASNSQRDYQCRKCCVLAAIILYHLQNTKWKCADNFGIFTERLFFN
jgi:hypothetical protein